MQELLCATDTLITDYSSSSGEALISEKNVLFMRMTIKSTLKIEAY